jgi:hypothetical protein
MMNIRRAITINEIISDIVPPETVLSEYIDRTSKNGDFEVDVLVLLAYETW